MTLISKHLMHQQCELIRVSVRYNFKTNFPFNQKSSKKDINEAQKNIDLSFNI